MGVVETTALVATRVAPEVGMKKRLSDDQGREREYSAKHGTK
jgi:hypothetical protein